MNNILICAIISVPAPVEDPCFRKGYESTHWMDHFERFNGVKGTGLTNFSRYQLPIYLEAIRRYNFKHKVSNKYWVSDKPMIGYSFNNSYSLHVDPSIRDSSEFWNTYSAVEAEDDLQYEKYLHEGNNGFFFQNPTTTNSIEMSGPFETKESAIFRLKYLKHRQ